MESAVQVIGIIIPMFTIAGSAVAFVVKYYFEAGERRRYRFFFLMQTIDGEGTIAAKLAAVYQLREFKEHSEFVARFCNSQTENVTGSGARFLIDELRLTASFFDPQQH